MKPLLKKLAVGIGAFALVGFIAGILVNSSRIASVTVTLLPGREEPKDVVLPGQQGALPDYRLQVRSNETWIDCGTFQDTPIDNGLTWTVPGALPERTFAGYKLLERDRGFDGCDLLSPEVYRWFFTCSLRNCLRVE